MIVMRKNSLDILLYYLVILCFLWFPFQDLFLSFLYKIKPGPYIKIFLVGKEIVLLFSLVLLIFKKVAASNFIFSKVDILGFFYIFICIIYLFFWGVEGISFFTSMTCFRTVVLPVLLFLWGKWVFLKKENADKIVKMIIILSVFDVLIGFVETVLPTDVFWNGILDLYGYLTNIKGFQDGLNGGFISNVPGNFWAFLGLRRMAGGHASPLALGYFLVLPLAFLISKKRIFKFQIVLAIVIIIGVILTESRAAIISAVAFVLLYINISEKFFSLKINKKALLITFLLMTAIFIVLTNSKSINFIISTITMKEGRSIGHMEALERSVENVKSTIFIGKGFGVAGGWASLQGSKESGAGESTYFTIMYQIGGIGLVVFLMFLVILLYNFFRLYMKQKREEYLIIAILLIAYSFTGIISEQILTFTSVAHFWFLCGIYLNKRFNNDISSCKSLNDRMVKFG